MSDELIAAAADLYAFVEATERLKRPPEPRAASRFAAWAAELSQRWARATSQAGDDLRQRADAVRASLHGFATALEQGPTAATLRSRWRSLSREYEAICLDIRRRRWPLPDGVRLGRIKPKNVARNLFHVANGVLGVGLYELGVGRWQLLALGSLILAAFVVMDVSRRIFPAFNTLYVDKIFGPIARPGDAHSTPASTWYMLGLLVALLVLPMRAVEVGVLVLAFADPVASLAGKTWGKRKLYGDKSWAGTLAFALTAFVVVLAFLATFAPELGPGVIARVALAAAVAGSVTELVSGGRLDDNLTIPLLSGGVAALLL